VKKFFERIQGVYLIIKLFYLLAKLKKLQEGNLKLMRENRLLTEELLREERARKFRLQSQMTGAP
jgi:hypothetical protein